jgi:hypothetical protein
MRFGRTVECTPSESTPISNFLRTITKASALHSLPSSHSIPLGRPMSANDMVLAAYVDTPTSLLSGLDSTVNSLNPTASEILCVHLPHVDYKPRSHPKRWSDSEKCQTFRQIAFLWEHQETEKVRDHVSGMRRPLAHRPISVSPVPLGKRTSEGQRYGNIRDNIEYTLPREQGCVSIEVSLFCGSVHLE